jgi:two-component system, OmpR family, phosphate regulon response regulator OmpR
VSFSSNQAAPPSEDDIIKTVPDRILIIDDDERLTEMLSVYLRSRGFEVDCRADARGGISALEGGKIDAVILDVMLPDMDGFEVCRRVRAKSEVPILMLTARGDATDRVVGLEIGADDYLPKPFDPRELLARLGAVLRRTRRTSIPPAAPLRFGRLTIDKQARAVLVDGRSRELTGRQYDMLLLLAERAGRVQTREQIMEALGGEGWDSVDRSIDVHVSRIRNAIEDDPKHPQFVRTIRGAGYLFSPSFAPGESGNGSDA